MWFKKQLIVLKLILAMFVNARSWTSEKEKFKTRFPVSSAQKDYVAENVCSNLEMYIQNESGTDQKKCMENFKWHLDPNKQGVHLRCHSNWSVTFETAPVHSFQLILLIPEPNNNDPFSLIYDIVKPNTTFETIDIEPNTKYMSYSTNIDKYGRPSKWHRGSPITKWMEPPYKEYKVQVDFLNASKTLDAMISWNHTGDSDTCFDFAAKCVKLPHIKYTEIKPGTPRRVKVEGLPVNDSCYVTLTGFYGVTSHYFNTPGEAEQKLKYVTDLSIEAEEYGEYAWTVHVAWQKATSVNPDFYNVTIRSNLNEVYSIVPGNATETILNNITGKGIYYVSVKSTLGRETAHTSRRAIFPNHSTSWRWAGAASGAWGAAILGMVAAAFCWLRFRRQALLHDKPQIIKPIKPVDEIPPDVVVVPKRTTDRWEIKSERLTLHEVLGEGAFGVVRRGILAPTEKEVAVKMLRDFPAIDELRAFRLEMELMKSVGAHPHVVSLVGCCTEKPPLIIAEYCSRGDLLSFLRLCWDVMISKRNTKYYTNNNNSPYRNDLFTCKIPQEHCKLVVNKMYDIDGACEPELTSLDLLSFCRQIAMGMEFLASNRLVHRDLAARNILVTGDRTLKIADFGLSRDVYEENQYKQKGNGKMPVKWMALESLTRRIYTTQSDVWSFGVVMWEVVTVGCTPYPEVPATRLLRLLRAGYRMPRPLNCSKQLYDLMQSCWRESPRERPTFADLHEQLDALLNSACADEYLSLELDDEPPPAPKAQKYLKLIMRAKRNWTRGESYERPLKATHNHYTSPPVTLNKTPV